MSSSKLTKQSFGEEVILSISSTLTVASDDTPNIVPNLSAAFATARSPSKWNNRCTAVGEQ